MHTKAKKSYGQHFLANSDIARRIADALLLDDECPAIVEVGPGKGMLTQFLRNKGKDLFLVEADPDMVEWLNKHMPEVKPGLIYSDFLKLHLDTAIHAPSFALIGNFPYNISSQIVFHMLKYRDRIPQMVGMFQKEMALRIVADKGSKIYGVISVLTQAYYTAEYLFSVAPGSFSPPPKVQSGVIRLMRKPDDSLTCDHRLFRIVVKQAFSQRRKMLRNTMKTFLKGDELLSDSFFEQRPEQLSVQDFEHLTNLISERKTDA